MTAAVLAGAGADVVEAILDAVDVPVLAYFLVMNTTMLILVLFAAAEFGQYIRRVDLGRRDESVSSRLTPGISVLVPMHNEEAGIVTSVTSLLALRYPRHEVVVIDDGSTDGGFAALQQAFDLVEVPREIPSDIPVQEPPTSVHMPRDGRTRLTVVRKENSGKTDSVNNGINAAVEDLVAIVDADSILEPDCLLTVTKPFADDPTRMIATGGVVRAANGCTTRAGRIIEINTPPNWLARIQVVEYLRAFYLGRVGWSRFNGLIMISGAFGVFRRDVVVEVGGLDHTSIGEDFELVMRIHRHMQRTGRDYAVRFVAEPVCWTEVPSTRAVLRRQRVRWHRGLWETLWRHRGMMLNPRYGRIGMLAVPYYWFFELIAPVIELAGLALMVTGLVFGVIDVPFAILFMLVAYGYGMLVTLASMAIEELSFHRYPRWRDLAVSAVAAVLENVGYRQATAWWRIRGWWASLTRRKQVWGTMTRSGFTAAATDPESGAA
jgi:cellulose synthase/poly-beta-1,6-N-acetylglucosamine synthase-like glycosyltransferase